MTASKLRFKVTLPIAVLTVLWVVAACTASDDPSPVDDVPISTTQNTVVAVPTSEPVIEVPALRTPTEPPPALDTSVAGVPLDQVVFDAFRGGYIPLSAATEEDVEFLRDRIKPVYEPKYDDADGGDWLRPDDLVMGYESRDAAFAYPVKMLDLHEIVNEVIDGHPVLISYCPLCGSGVVYSRQLDGQVLLFGNTSALYESDLVMYDHETGSYWFQTLGEAIVGPLTGQRLNMLASVTTTWARWKELHPTTKILSAKQGLIPWVGDKNPYDRAAFTGYAGRLNEGQFVFPVDSEKLDPRLDNGHMVIAVELAGNHKAYPLSSDRDRVIKRPYWRRARTGGNACQRSLIRLIPPQG